MKQFSDLTKYFGIPSLVSIALGGGLLWYSGNAENRYHYFIEETSRTIPIVRQVDSLDNTLDDLFDSEKALTRYMIKPQTIVSTGKTVTIIPEIYHDPDVEESLDQLNSARENIRRGNFLDNYEVRTLDSQIRIIQNELAWIERGKSEKFYEPQRTEIEGLQEKAYSELESLKKEVPSHILEKRKFLMNRAESSSNAGEILGVLGLIGIVTYGLVKVMDRYF